MAVLRNEIFDFARKRFTDSFQLPFVASLIVEQQRNLERHVRTMLRRARTNERLAELEIVGELCIGLGTTNASAMLRELVEAAFGDTPQEQKLRKVIFDCDIDGVMTQEGAARSLGISNRQFYRLRSQAMRAIAQTIARILYDTTDESATSDELEVLARSLAASRPGAASQIFSLLPSASVSTRLRAMRAQIDAGIPIGEDDVRRLPESSRPTALVLLAQSRMLRGEDPSLIQSIVQDVGELASRPGSGYDDSTRFELELLNFLRAKSHNDAIAMRSSARNLTRLAGERRSLLTRASAASTEALMRCGDFAEARRQTMLLQAQAGTAHNVKYLGVATLMNAQMLFVEGAHERALTAARAARVALAPYGPFALRAEVLLGRIAVANGAAWAPQETAAGFGAESWERCAFSLVCARHLLAGGAIDDAFFTTNDALEHARTNEYRGLHAHALVTLGAIEDARGNELAAQSLYRAGIVEHSGVFDILAAYDFFAMPTLKQRAFGPLENIEPVINGLMLRLQRSIPDLAHAGNALDVWRRLIGALISGTDAIEARDIYRYPAIHRSITKYADAIQSALALGAAPILPLSNRSAFLEAASGTIHAIVSVGTSRNAG